MELLVSSMNTCWCFYLINIYLPLHCVTHSSSLQTFSKPTKSLTDECIANLIPEASLQVQGGKHKQINWWMLLVNDQILLLPTNSNCLIQTNFNNCVFFVSIDSHHWLTENAKPIHDCVCDGSPLNLICAKIYLLRKLQLIGHNKDYNQSISHVVRTCLQLIFKLFYKEGTGRIFMSLLGLQAKMKAKLVKPFNVWKCHTMLPMCSWIRSPILSS